MVEIVEFDLATFNRDAQLAEDLMILRNEQEKKNKIDSRFLTKNDRRLLAKLMVRAAYNHDDSRIDKYTNFIYRKLFGRKWYYNQVWIDQPINWLDVDLIEWAHEDDVLCDEQWTYEQLFNEAYHLIDELCNDRDNINELHGICY